MFFLRNPHSHPADGTFTNTGQPMLNKDHALAFDDDDAGTVHTGQAR